MSQTPKTHHYSVNVLWTGNLGQGTANYRAYGRSHEITAPGKPPILGSADPAFRGEATRYNPEEMLVAAVSTCHMLWYLHLCAAAGIVVADYRDQPTGTMTETVDGSGRFTEITLYPVVAIATGDGAIATQLHEQAHRYCFVANSVNFPVRCVPTVTQSSNQ